MSISLKYLYQDIKKYEIKLIAGENGLKNDVRLTHVVENEEVASFLQGQEFVFITGIALKDDNELLDLVKKVKDYHASGIIINTGQYITNIGQDVISFCNENELPLFIAPWHVRMADIIKILNMKIIESEKTYFEVTNAIKSAIFTPTNKESYLPILKKVGFKYNWTYTVTVMEVEVKDSKIHNIEHYTSNITSIIEEELSYMRENFFSVYVGNSIITLFYNKQKEEVELILKDLYNRLTKQFKNLKFHVGRGKSINCLEKLNRGYEDAKSSAKVYRLLTANNVHIKYSELYIYKLLLAIEDKEMVKKFYDDTIGVLDIHDKINETDYVELLMSYFENNCKVTETANSLYVHRNTVNYKINKIQEILDLNLSDIGDRSRVYLSLMIKYLI